MESFIWHGDKSYKMDVSSIKLDFTIDSNCILSKLMTFKETTKQKEGVNDRKSY